MAKKMTKKMIRDLTTAFGFTLDPTQIDALYMAENNVEAFLSWCRQAGKTETILAWLILGAVQGYSGLFFSHDSNTVNAAMARFSQVCVPLMDPSVGLVKKISPSNGFTQVEFTSGAMVYFRVRTPGAGRGLTFDRIVFDEAAIMDGSALAEVTPTLTNSKQRRILMAGTPPTPDDIRKYGTDTPWIKARAAGKNWMELSSAPEYDPELPTDLEAVRKANPMWRRITDLKGLIELELSKMSHEAFCRERLGVWNLPKPGEQHDPYLTKAEVDAMLTTQGTRDNTRFTAAIGILPGADEAYIAMSDGAITEIAETFDIGMGQLYELVDWITERARTQIDEIRIPNNQRGKALEKMLREKRLSQKVKMITVPEASSKISLFLKQTSEGSLKVYKSDETYMALTSFWLGIVPMSGSVDIRAGLDNDAARVIALTYATREGKLLDRATPIKLRSW
jgi:hypothetical protein